MHTAELQKLKEPTKSARKIFRKNLRVKKSFLKYISCIHDPFCP